MKRIGANDVHCSFFSEIRRKISYMVTHSFNIQYSMLNIGLGESERPTARAAQTLYWRGLDCVVCARGDRRDGLNRPAYNAFIYIERLAHTVRRAARALSLTSDIDDKLLSN